MTIEHVDTCTSTMDEARRRAHDGAPDGTVVVAKTMDSGRGRSGHVWHAPEGGLYLSMVLRDLPDPHLLTLALGNAIADILEVAGAEPRLKWVNDVMVDDRKIAGVLVEAESVGADIDFIVAGIGINFNGDATTWPEELAPGAVTLEQILGTETCIEDTEEYVLETMQEWIGKVRAGDEHDIIAAFRSRDWLAGKRVRVDGLDGIAAGIDDDGALLLETDGGVRPAVAGSVEIL